ncbi:MAG: metal ABC transporter ATP-binding protein [Muribaculaceae bacterium]
MSSRIIDNIFFSRPALSRRERYTHAPTRADSPEIVIEGVSMRREYRYVLEDVSLTINAGDFVAITGPNGGGKTTLLRIILGLIKPTRGSVSFYAEGARVSKLPVGYLPQKNQIDSHFPISVREVVASGLLGLKTLSPQERRLRVAKVLDEIEMAAYAERPIGRLSGGQLQRTLLGRAIISEPRVLVLDEPLSYIDKRFESHIYDIIASLAPHTTILLVSHEMTTIASMANRHIIVDRYISECSAAHHYVRTECDD